MFVLMVAMKRDDVRNHLLEQTRLKVKLRVVVLDMLFEIMSYTGGKRKNTKLDMGWEK